MATNVKNTFINVEEQGGSPEMRTKRRNKTEPVQGVSFASVCMAAEGSDDEDEQDQQPVIDYTKTYDHFDKACSPIHDMPATVSSATAQSSSPGQQKNLQTAVVRNTFIDVDEEGPQEAINRSKTAPSRRVAFLGCGGDESEEDDSESEAPPQKVSAESRQRGLSHQKTYDAFEAPLQPMVQGGVSPQHSPSPTQQGMPATASMLQQPQVFTIPIPVGLPAGATHAIQLPMGLPPGSTIVVMPSNMGPVPPGGAGMPGMVQSGVLPTAAPMPQGAQAMPGMMMGGGSAFGGSVQLQPQTILKSTRADGSIRITYCVDARKLKANDKAIISPPFEISEAIPGQYRVIINPSPTKARGGSTFKNTAGMGNVQLKCEDPTSGTISFHISTSDGRPNSIRSELPRGPVEHDFADGGVCGLARKQEEWDFNRAVDGPSKTFTVHLDIAQ